MDYTYLHNHLRNNGFTGLPISVCADGTIYGKDDLTDAQQAQLSAAIDSYDPLPYLKTDACSRIDATAEALRQNVLTPGSGQAAEYYLTHAEALNYLALVSAGKTPTDTDYPFLLAEQAALAATTGAVTLTAVATAIMTDVGTSKTALAAIKEARRKGKLAVNAATDAAGVAAAEAAVVWPEG